MVKNAAPVARLMPIEVVFKIKRSHILLSGGSMGNAHVQVHINDELYDKTGIGSEWNHYVRKGLLRIDPALKISFYMYTGANNILVFQHENKKGEYHCTLGDLLVDVKPNSKAVEKVMILRTERGERAVELVIDVEIKETRLFSIESLQSGISRDSRDAMEHSLPAALIQRIGAIDGINKGLRDTILSILIDSGSLLTVNNLVDFVQEIEYLKASAAKSIVATAPLPRYPYHKCFYKKLLQVPSAHGTVDVNYGVQHDVTVVDSTSREIVDWLRTETERISSINKTYVAYNDATFHTNVPRCSSVYDVSVENYFMHDVRSMSLESGIGYELCVHCKPRSNGVVDKHVVNIKQFDDYLSVLKELSYMQHAHKPIFGRANEVPMQIAADLLIQDGRKEIWQRILFILDYVAQRMVFRFTVDDIERKTPFSEVSHVVASMSNHLPWKYTLTLTVYTISSAHIQHVYATARVGISDALGAQNVQSKLSSTRRINVIPGCPVADLLMNESMDLLLSELGEYVELQLVTEESKAKKVSPVFARQHISLRNLKARLKSTAELGEVTETQTVWLHNGIRPHNLDIYIDRMEGLLGVDLNGMSDPFLCLYFADCNGAIIPAPGSDPFICRTKHQSATLNPRWNLNTTVSSTHFSSAMAAARFIYVEIWDYNTARQKQPLGEVYLPITAASQPLTCYAIQYTRNMTRRNNNSSGGTNLGRLYAKVNMTYAPITDRIPRDPIRMSLSLSLKPVATQDYRWPARVLSHDSKAMHDELLHCSLHHKHLEVTVTLSKNHTVLHGRREFYAAMKEHVRTAMQGDTTLVELQVPYSQLQWSKVHILTENMLLCKLHMSRNFRGTDGKFVLREAQVDVLVGPCLAEELYLMLYDRITSYTLQLQVETASVTSDEKIFDATAKVLQGETVRRIDEIEELRAQFSAVVMSSWGYLSPLRILYLRKAKLQLYFWYVIDSGRNSIHTFTAETVKNLIVTAQETMYQADAAAILEQGLVQTTTQNPFAVKIEYVLRTLDSVSRECIFYCLRNNLPNENMLELLHQLLYGHYLAVVTYLTDILEDYEEQQQAEIAAAFSNISSNLDSADGGVDEESVRDGSTPFPAASAGSTPFRPFGVIKLVKNIAKSAVSKASTTVASAVNAVGGGSKAPSRPSSRKSIVKVNTQKRRDVISFILVNDHIFDSMLTPNLFTCNLKFTKPPFLSICMDFDDLIDKFSLILEENLDEWNEKTLNYFREHRNDETPAEHSWMPWEMVIRESTSSGLVMYVSDIPETVQNILNVQIGLKKIPVEEDLSYHSMVRIYQINLRIAAGIAKAYQTVAGEYEDFLKSRLQEILGKSATIHACAGEQFTCFFRKIGSGLVDVGGAVIGGAVLGVVKTVNNLVRDTNTADQEEARSTISTATAGSSAAGSKSDGSGGEEVLLESKDDLMCFLMSIVNDCARMHDVLFEESIASFNADANDDFMVRSLTTIGNAADVSSSSKPLTYHEKVRKIFAKPKVSILVVRDLAVNELVNQLFLYTEMRPLVLQKLHKHLLKLNSVLEIPFLRRQASKTPDGSDAYSAMEVICATLQAFYQFVATHVAESDVYEIVYACLKKLAMCYIISLRDLMLRLQSGSYVSAMKPNPAAGGAGAGAVGELEEGADNPYLTAEQFAMIKEDMAVINRCHMSIVDIRVGDMLSTICKVIMNFLDGSVCMPEHLDTFLQGQFGTAAPKFDLDVVAYEKALLNFVSLNLVFKDLTMVQLEHEISNKFMVQLSNFTVANVDDYTFVVAVRRPTDLAELTDLQRVLLDGKVHQTAINSRIRKGSGDLLLQWNELLSFDDIESLAQKAVTVQIVEIRPILKIRGDVVLAQLQLCLDDIMRYITVEPRSAAPQQQHGHHKHHDHSSGGVEGSEEVFGCGHTGWYIMTDMRQRPSSHASSATNSPNKPGSTEVSAKRRPSSVLSSEKMRETDDIQVKMTVRIFK